MTHATPIPDIVTLHVLFRMPKRGGQKEIQLPPGATLQRMAHKNADQGAGPRVSRHGRSWPPARALLDLR
jgi:hypothetical protein